MKTRQTTGMPSLRMRRPDEEMVLDDLAALVPAELLKQTQEAFSAALGVPVLFVSASAGPVAKPDAMDTFCWRITRHGRPKKPCAACRRPSPTMGQDLKSCPIVERQAASTFDCPLGLLDLALPITAGDPVVGYVLTSLMTDRPADVRAMAAARQLGLTAAAALNYASHVPVVSSERVLEIAKGLMGLSTLVSRLAAMARKNKLIELRDPLTGLASRARFWHCLAKELEIADSHNYPVSVLLIDLDDFKRINDHFGHATGDAVLHAVGQVLGHEIRQSDLAARYGSDAFVVMLRCADSSGADIVAWRLKSRIAGCKLTARGQPVPVSASVAHITYPICAARDPDAIFKELLAALNRACQPARPQERRKAA